MDVRQLDLSVVAENVFVWSFGPKCSVSPPSDCTLEILLLTLEAVHTSAVCPERCIHFDDYVGNRQHLPHCIMTGTRSCSSDFPEIRCLLWSRAICTCCRRCVVWLAIRIHTQLSSKLGFVYFCFSDISTNFWRRLSSRPRNYDLQPNIHTQPWSAV